MVAWQHHRPSMTVVVVVMGMQAGGRAHTVWMLQILRP